MAALLSHRADLAAEDAAGQTPLHWAAMGDAAAAAAVLLDHGAHVQDFRRRPAIARRSDLVAVLQSWMDEEDAGEQRATGDYLVHALDEDRLSERPLFPAEQKGATW